MSANLHTTEKHFLCNCGFVNKLAVVCRLPQACCCISFWICICVGVSPPSDTPRVLEEIQIKGFIFHEHEAQRTAVVQESRSVPPFILLYLDLLSSICLSCSAFLSALFPPLTSQSLGPFGRWVGKVMCRTVITSLLIKAPDAWSARRRL